jgi:hypothetical protein
LPRPSTSNSIMRWHTNWIMSRSKSVSEPFSIAFPRRACLLRPRPFRIVRIRFGLFPARCDMRTIRFPR